MTGEKFAKICKGIFIDSGKCVFVCLWLEMEKKILIKWFILLWIPQYWIFLMSICDHWIPACNLVFQVIFYSYFMDWMILYAFMTKVTTCAKTKVNDQLGMNTDRQTGKGVWTKIEATNEYEKKKWKWKILISDDESDSEHRYFTDATTWHMAACMVMNKFRKADWLS